MNAGGPYVVNELGHGYGVCGDPAQTPLPRKHEAGGLYATPPIIAAKFSKGQSFHAKIVLTANHKGRFRLRLCPLPDPGTPQQEASMDLKKCFKKKHHTLSPSWTYVHPSINEYIVHYTLPKSVTCKRCVLQWHYETGNSCNRKNTPPQFLTPGLSTCSKKNKIYGEAFWNCADIQIV
jgi:hypothetical protein